MWKLSPRHQKNCTFAHVHEAQHDAMIRSPVSMDLEVQLSGVYNAVPPRMSSLSASWGSTVTQRVCLHPVWPKQSAAYLVNWDITPLWLVS